MLQIIRANRTKIFKFQTNLSKLIFTSVPLTCSKNKTNGIRSYSEKCCSSHSHHINHEESVHTKASTESGLNPELDFNQKDPEAIYYNYRKLLKEDPKLESQLPLTWYMGYVHHICNSIHDSKLQSKHEAPDSELNSSIKNQKKILALIIEDKILTPDRLKGLSQESMNQLISDITKIHKMGLSSKISSIVCKGTKYQGGYSSITLNYLLLLYLTDRNLSSMIEFLEFIQSKNYPIFPSTTTPIVRFLSSYDRHNAIDQLLEYVLKNSSESIDIKSLTTFIQVYCNHGRTESAERIVQMLPELNIEPDEYVYGSLIAGYLENGELDKATTLYQKQFADSNNQSSNLVVENIMMKAKPFNLDHCLSIFNFIKSNGITPNLFFYHTLMTCYVKRGEIESAKNLVDELESNGLESTWMTYSILLSYYHDKRDLNGALNILDQMKTKKITQDIQIYNIIIDLAYKLNAPEVGKKLLSKALEMNLKPNTNSYNVLMHYYIKSIDFNNSAKVYNMMKRHKVPIDAIALDNYLHSQIKLKNWKGAKEEYNSMVYNQKLRPDSRLIATMLLGFANNENLSDMIAFFNKAIHTHKIAPSIIMYNHIISAYAKRDMILSADKILEQALKASEKQPNCLPNTNTWVIFLTEAIKNGNLEQMEREIEKFQSEPFNLRPDTLILQELMFGYGKFDMHDKAIDIFKQLEAKSKSKITKYIIRSYLFSASKVLTTSEYVEEFGRLCDQYPPNIINTKEVFSMHVICLFKRMELQTILDLVINRMHPNKHLFRFDIVSPIYSRLKSLKCEEFELLKIFIENNHPELVEKLEDSSTQQSKYFISKKTNKY